MRRRVSYTRSNTHLRPTAVHRATKFSDEQVCWALRAMHDGMRVASVAQKLGAHPEMVNKWRDGTTRRHCWLQVQREREIQYQNRVMRYGKDLPVAST